MGKWGYDIHRSTDDRQNIVTYNKWRVGLAVLVSNLKKYTKMQYIFIIVKIEILTP